MVEQKKTTTSTETRTRVALSPTEERVVRMRYGLSAPTDLVLEQLGEGNPDLEEQLAEIEQRALRAVGARNNATKRKIVNALRRKKRE